MPDVNQQSSTRPSFRRSLARAAGVIALVSTLAAAPGAYAQDASFGCKVLLRAAATAPGWTGIPYCVPVMQQLIRQVGRGGAWPVCLEGQVASPSSAASAAGAPEAAPSLDVTAARN